MERRRAIVAAATAALTLAAGAAAISLNSGIVGATSDRGPGHIVPVDDSVGPATTVHVDAPSTRSATAPSSLDDDGGDRPDDRLDDRLEGGGDDGARLEGDAPEYEGAGDDD